MYKVNTFKRERFQKLTRRLLLPPNMSYYYTKYIAKRVSVAAQVLTIRYGI
jgi:hypothetical protein